MYINEAAAVIAIKEVVEAYTTDFKIFPVKRKAENLKKKVVYFILQVLVDEHNENLFNDFMIKSVDDDKLEIIESNIKEDDRYLKELFLIKCSIDTYGIGK